MRFLKWFLITSSLAGASISMGAPSAATAAEAPKSKIEELFIWKMSDELSLNPTEEKKFSEMVRDLNQKKSLYNQQMQTELEQMKSAKTDKEKSAALTKYKKTLQSYNELSEEELSQTQKLLGVAKTVQYLQVKQDLTNRLKSLLANPEAAGTKKAALPPPNIIEEK